MTYLSKIYTDCETSKRLQELGIDLDSNVVRRGKEPERVSTLISNIDINGLIENIPKGFYKCYILEQILEELPKEIELLPLQGDGELILDMSDGILGYIGVFDGGERSEYFTNYYFNLEDFPNENLATIAARLLIKLKEGGEYGSKE